MTQGAADLLHQGRGAYTQIWQRALHYDAPQVSDQLTGFRHNAVSPIGLATKLPVIMSDRVAALQPPVFWLGGGEADLKCVPRASCCVSQLPSTFLFRLGLPALGISLIDIRLSFMCRLAM